MDADVLNRTVLCLSLEQVLNCVLIWCGMAVVTGSFAKMMVPGTRPHGTLSTLLIGFASITATSFVFKILYENIYKQEFNPVHPVNLTAAILLAGGGMFLYRFIADTITPRSR